MRTRRTNAKPHGGNRGADRIHNISRSHFSPTTDLVQQLLSWLEGVIRTGNLPPGDTSLINVRVTRQPAIQRLLVLLDAARSGLEEIAGEIDDPPEGVVEAADLLDEAVVLLAKVVQS